MKRCPYCAEEIQDNAVLCRYCASRVKGRWTSRIVIIILIIALSVLAYRYERRIRYFINDAKQTLYEVMDTLKIFIDAVKDLQGSVRSIKEYKEAIENSGNKILSGQ